MALTRTAQTRRWGVEYYSVEFIFPPEDTELIYQLTQTGKPVPEVIKLVWTRNIPGGWHRVVSGPHASKATGHVKSAMGPGYVGSIKSREIYDRNNYGALLPWAEMLPGLRDAIEGAQLYLPS